MDYSKFRAKVSQDKVVEDKIAANFIFSGNLATVISVNNVNISAALAYVNNVEERDRVYTYTHTPDTLNIGDIFTWRDEHYLIADHDKMVKNTYYNKYLAFECNFSYENSWGYIKGPMETYINTTIKDNHVEVSEAKPIAILPRNSYSVSDILVINDRPWLVIERDDYSTDGITYYSLQATTSGKLVDDSTLLPQTEEDPAIIKVHGLDVITVSTEDAYFSSNKKFDVTRTLNSIEFRVPFGYSDFYIQVKQGGAIQTISYKVVL